MFIYVFDEAVKKQLIAQGLKMDRTCILNGKKTFVFKNNGSSSEYLATFSKEHQKDILISNVAYFV